MLKSTIVFDPNDSRDDKIIAHLTGRIKENQNDRRRNYFN